MKTGEATGLQIAFLMFGVMLVAVPLSDFIIHRASLTGVTRALVEKGMHFGLACLLFGLVPPLRKFATKALAAPIPPSKRAEVALVTLGKLAQGFATAAALALWFFLSMGPAGVEGMASKPDRDFTNSVSYTGLVRLALAVLVAPVIEELVFRGLIYRAFERKWGWFASMLATSALFGLYHSHFWSAFTASVILVCLLRRTGTLRAPILAHAIFNLVMWWPLLGRFIFPDSGMTDLSTWHFHAACLVVVLVWVPIYVWVSRDRNITAPTAILEPNGAVPK